MPEGSVAYVCNPKLSHLPSFFRQKEQNFLNDINDLHHLATLKNITSPLRRMNFTT